MKEKIWITVKTYPTFSKKYFELVCTAGINEKGEWRRLYPIPFRQISEIEKYKKYQRVEADIQKDTGDPRPESYKLKGDINIISAPVDTKNNWEKRKRILEKKDVPIHLLFNLATGAGKTLLMACNILYLFEQGYRNFIFFVNQIQIVEKTKMET